MLSGQLMWLNWQNVVILLRKLKVTTGSVNKVSRLCLVQRMHDLFQQINNIQLLKLDSQFLIARRQVLGVMYIQV